MFESFADGLLLLLGMALGWALARRGTSASGHSAAGPHLSRAERISGFSSPTGEDADEALAALSRAVDAEPQAASLQLTLGSLFRRRGEAERAIRVHEALIGRSDLPPADLRAARLELAQDYLKAGLLDRAEILLQALAAGAEPAPALELLMELHEQSQSWEDAIEAARRWQSASGRSAGKRIAQYRCELAEAARGNGDTAAAERLASGALAEDGGCTRASLILAALAEARKDWPAAIDACLRAIEQDPRFAAEVLELLRRAHAAAGDAAGYARFLDNAGVALPGSAALAGARAQWLREQGQDSTAFLAAQLARRPTREVLLLWLEAHPELQDESAGLRGALQASVKSRPRYACSSCGLQPSLLFWKCPHCKNWGTVGPAEEAL